MPIDQLLLRDHVAFAKGTKINGSTFYAPYFSIKGMGERQFLCILPADINIDIPLEFHGNVSCIRLQTVGNSTKSFHPYVLFLINENIQQVNALSTESLEPRDHVFLSAHVCAESDMCFTPVAFKYTDDGDGADFLIYNPQDNAPVFVSHDTMIGVTIFDGESGGLLPIPSFLTIKQQPMH